ncbi:poly-gamma-glutamate hydrolase family protein [Nannocystaceae bacterium ST9]
MTTKQCTPPQFDRREFLLAVASGMPLLAQGCTEADLDEFRNGDPFAADPAPELGIGGPPMAMTAAIQVDGALLSQAALLADEQICSVPKSLVEIAVGDQVRVTRNAGEYALYTVAERRKSDNPGLVRMALDARLRLGTSDAFVASLAIPVVANLGDAEAQAQGELVERLIDDGNETGLIAIAPHGGAIEFNTDRQAEAVSLALGCSAWICKGWKVGGGAYDRWHITSTKISPRSFPALGQVANRGFAYCVAFHGIATGGVLIGGAAPVELKQMVQAAILERLPDPSIAVTIATPLDLYNADSPSNVVNWLTADGLGGLQIEQSATVRSLHWQAVANAVIDVYSQLI